MCLSGCLPRWRNHAKLLQQAEIIPQDPTFGFVKESGIHEEPVDNQVLRHNRWCQGVFFESCQDLRNRTPATRYGDKTKTIISCPKAASYHGSSNFKGNGSESSRPKATYCTVHHYYCVLKAFFNWCVREGLYFPCSRKVIVSRLTPTIWASFSCVKLYLFRYSFMLFFVVL
jgi:hypothetical protein